MREKGRCPACRLMGCLLQTDLLAPEQSSSPAQRGSCRVGDNVTHAGDSARATVASESWRASLCLLGPESSPQAMGQEGKSQSSPR